MLDARRDTALAFYEKVFGFTHETMTSTQGPYYVLDEGWRRARGHHPGRAARPGGRMDALRVGCGLRRHGEACRQLGAHIGLPPTDIPDVGRIAVFMDTSGAMIGIVKGKYTG